MSRDPYIKPIKLAESAQAELLNRLDITSQVESIGMDDPNINRRSAPRIPYRQTNVEVSVKHPGGTKSCLLVTARNISRGGLGFLHGGFIYPGSPCELRMPRVDGRFQEVKGIVVSCRHVNGSLYEVGVRFEEPDEPAPTGETPEEQPPKVPEKPTSKRNRAA